MNIEINEITKPLLLQALNGELSQLTMFVLNYRHKLPGEFYSTLAGDILTLSEMIDAVQNDKDYCPQMYEGSTFDSITKNRSDIVSYRLQYEYGTPEDFYKVN